MDESFRIVEQNILDGRLPAITIYKVAEKLVTDEIIDQLLNPNQRSIGIAAAYTSKRILNVLAIASGSTVLLVDCQSKAKSKSEEVLAARKILQDRIFCDDNVLTLAFDLGPLALALFHDRGMKISNGIDVQSCCQSEVEHGRRPEVAIEFLIRNTKYTANKANIIRSFDSSTWDEKKSPTYVAQRAWVAALLHTIPDIQGKLEAVPPVNTMKLADKRLVVIADQSHSNDRLSQQQPVGTAHDFTAIGSKGRRVEIRLDRFQNRIIGDNEIGMTVRDNGTGAIFDLPGRTLDSRKKGRSRIIKTTATLEGRTVVALHTNARDMPTLAEQEKQDTLLKQLQGCIQIFDSPFIQTIWPGNNTEVTWPDTLTTLTTTPPIMTELPLNNSQQAAINHMLTLDNDHRFSIIQGPPGTGKTAVIAAFTASSIAAGRSGIWLIAQSNVAVKNIAEKLAKIGFEPWRLLVSQDFHYDWHSHIYHDFSRKVIQSSHFGFVRKDPKALEGCKVILCTLSMLSNYNLHIFTLKIPINYLVVDEASQINVSDYIAPLSSISTIQKLCFIGDDKQLPPYGQEEVEEVQSIFEITHLHETALLLDIQYRMPPQIGEFISDAVYDGQLRSNPEHLQADAYSCFFVEIPTSQESINLTSYQNKAEAEIAIKMAASLQEKGDQFKIITPYDAQRNLIENGLKNKGLVWQDKCFNVDSFQGNEENIIILSLVRSSGLGFLEDMRRTNVMLTRCKECLYVCSSWKFLIEGPGNSSLVGRMAAHMGEDAWLTVRDIEEDNF